MKRVIRLLLVAFPLIVLACTKTPTNDDSSDNHQPEFYVKYASEGLGTTDLFKYNVSYKDEKGEEKSFSNLNADSFERTIGPVSMGFEASFRIWVYNTNDSRTRFARIEVKKDDGPFAVKAEKSGKGYSGVSVSYTIE